uniref:Uncharacterized protein n=1 Tax=Rhizophora mucronata TaxID=61149 RepID=A0A2P2ND90_RHIMU
MWKISVFSNFFSFLFVPFQAYVVVKTHIHCSRRYSDRCNQARQVSISERDI